MPKKTASLAKLSRPRTHGSYPRLRLFAVLDECRGAPVVWIAGPPGAGKTTLAASYLDARDPPSLWYQLDRGDGDPASFFYYLRQAAAWVPGRKHAPLPLLTAEYLADLPGFARRWWRGLFARLPDGVVLVLDNYQELPPDSPLHPMLAAAAEEIPDGACLMVLCRSDPPPALARLLASQRIARLEWDDLRLTLDEARGIALIREPPTDREIAELHTRCDGWAAGFVLMRERMRRTGELNRLGEILPRETVFDYFATQIFSDTPRKARETLIRTAFLPRFTVSMAERIGADPQAGELLSYWHEHRLFIDCRTGAEPTYQYHALFRAFLLSQARRYYTPAEVARLRGLAAGLLEQQSELDEALDLYLAAGAFEPAARLILRHAQSLLAAGRAWRLAQWIGRLPMEIAERFPWVLYWSGASRLPTHPALARDIFARARALLGGRGDTLGEIRSAVGIIDAYYLERADFAPLDPWIALIFERIGNCPAFADAADELAAVSSTMIATLYRQPAHPRLPWLAQRTRTLIDSEVDANRKVAAGAFLLNYDDWTGETADAEALVALVRPLLSHPDLAPLWRASWELRLSIHHLVLGEFATARENLRLAGTIARDNGFAAIGLTALLFETLLCLCESDIARAESALAQIDARLDPARRMDFSLALKFKGWVALARGDPAAAVQLGERASEASEAAGAPNMLSHTLIYLAHFYSEQGEYARARAAIGRARACTALARYPVLRFDAELVCADLHLREGDLAGCETALRTALDLGARRGYFGGLFWIPAMMGRLCAFALARGIETEYVKRLIARRNLERPGPEATHWPWRLRVFALGTFALERDGEPVRFAGKVPKKPLDLLKALIAYGAQEVAAETLCAALWPDAEGDAADNALAITLKRLRKLLRDERAVIQRGGKLSLDPGRCWVDVQALQGLLQRVDALVRSRGAVAELLEIAAELGEQNRGAFLASEPERPWVLPLRDRLRARVTRAVLSLGEVLEQRGQTEGAIALYARALEQDNLSEALYRRLIACHARLGQQAEAMAVYRRCRELLSVVLGIAPSAETERLLRTLRPVEPPAARALAAPLIGELGIGTRSVS